MPLADPPLSSESPAMAAAPRPPAPTRPPRTGPLRATAVIATVGVVVALVGIGIVALPVRSPLQDCGSAFSFLYEGRTNDAPADPARPPDGHTRAEVEATNRTPCRPRAVDRAQIGGGLFAVGMVIAIGATGTEITSRLRRHRTARKLAAGDRPLGA